MKPAQGCGRVVGFVTDLFPDSHPLLVSLLRRLLIASFRERLAHLHVQGEPAFLFSRSKETELVQFLPSGVLINVRSCRKRESSGWFVEFRRQGKFSHPQFVARVAE